jgi:hypothetical protein
MKLLPRKQLRNTCYSQLMLEALVGVRAAFSQELHNNFAALLT